MKQRQRTRRLLDFESRRSDDPAGQVEDLRGTEFLAVHPFSDDKALLAAINWTPSKCNSVDAYWLAFGDVVFVQVHSATVEPARPVGRYVRWSGGERPHVNLVAVVQEKRITRAVFERELLAFLDGGSVAGAIKKGAKVGLKLKPV